ncbi:NAD(P)/FAD-dependent oxidoreductase [Pseudoxanthomonas mexicana]|uniref:NAD(P)/FAD-dependent oxidoreductase n=1 Tax=Pseudoxanthomonas mexicana TaxID=128785 RepID=UPI00398B95A9
MKQAGQDVVQEAIREPGSTLLDAIIVGGGPAGLTAAIYLLRTHRACLVLDTRRSRAAWIPESNNCPGFPQGVSGPALLERMRRQAEEFGAEFVEAEATRLAREDDTFRVGVRDGRTWRARKVILATGVVDRLPDAPWTAAAIARGAMRLCSICDAYEATDADIGVYGPSASIVGHGRFLRTYSARVTLLPTDEPDAGARAAAAADALSWLPPGGDLRFDGARCGYAAPAGRLHVFDTVYPFLGCDTRVELACQVGAELSANGELPVDRQQMTQVPGLYAIGDVVSGLNQISVAVGQAAIAATHAHAQLPHAPRRAAAP